jgi:hypothetical protein
MAKNSPTQGLGTKMRTGPTGPGGGNKPPTSPAPGSGRKPVARVIKHFSKTHTKKGEGFGNARALRKLYRGGAPTAAEKAQFAKDHPKFVKNNPKVARRTLGVGKKTNTSKGK